MKRLLISLALAGMAGAPVLAQDKPAPKQTEAQKKAAQEQQIADLVDLLGAKEYKVRQQAYQDLVKIGPPAVKALEEAKQSDDPEVAASAAEALAAIRAGHKLPTPKKGKKETRPRTSQPQGLDERDLPGLQPIPGQDEMLEQLQKQFPEMRKLLEGMRGGGGKGGPQFRLLNPDDPMFKELFGGRNPFSELFGGQDENDPNKPRTRSRSRSFTWSNVPQRRAGPSGALGVRCRSVTPVLRSQLSLPQRQGLVVHQLLPQSFAKTQGLQQFDIILEVEGKPIRTELDLRGLVAKGGKVTILRKAKRQSLTFTKAPKTQARPIRPRRLRPAEPRQPRPKKPAPAKPDDTRDF
jgi:HEAT repeat protein